MRLIFHAIFHDFHYLHLHFMCGIETYANTCVTYLDKLVKINNEKSAQRDANTARWL